LSGLFEPRGQQFFVGLNSARFRASSWGVWLQASSRMRVRASSVMAGGGGSDKRMGAERVLRAPVG